MTIHLCATTMYNFILLNDSHTNRVNADTITITITVATTTCNNIVVIFTVENKN